MSLSVFVAGAPFSGRDLILHFLYIIGFTILAFIGVILGVILFAISLTKRHRKHAVTLRVLAALFVSLNILLVYSPVTPSSIKNAINHRKQEEDKLSKAAFTVYLPEDYENISLSAGQDRLTFRSRIANQTIYVEESVVVASESEAGVWQPLICRATACETIKGLPPSNFDVFAYKSIRGNHAYTTRLGDTKVNIYATDSSVNIDNAQAVRFFNSLSAH